MVTDTQVPFLASLALRTIVSLTTEHPTRALLSYARASGVQFVSDEYRIEELRAVRADRLL